MISQDFTSKNVNLSYLYFEFCSGHVLQLSKQEFENKLKTVFRMPQTAEASSLFLAESPESNK